ncbi:phosphodiester glycosidase family protein [Demequina sp. NBRC 110052]|uniref:phosphodiester glycosidase family protein n=1 Tax=Demequina sp. NBRC 110052 TaxID=1570341 RepID=UPI000A06CF76|nr:phosphodiester glycosidase family protein [Demequina sp. NBRC 110052]
MPRRLASGILSLVGVLALAACASGEPAPARTVTVTPSPSATSGSAGPSAPAGPTGSATPSAIETVEFDGQSFDVAVLDLDAWEVRVVWDPEASDGTYLGEVEGDVLTNAGIFTPSYVPGGLLVSDGETLVGLNLNEGSGNFHLLPNAVFALHEDGSASVVDSTQYDGTGVTQATQSGPALVLDGSLHPAFTPGSTNTAIRNGVGVTADGRTVVLAISRAPVNLETFARLFRDALDCPDALYLDGQISGLWAAGAGRDVDLVLQPYAGVISATRAP